MKSEIRLIKVGEYVFPENTLAGVNLGKKEGDPVVLFFRDGGRHAHSPDSIEAKAIKAFYSDSRNVFDLVDELNDPRAAIRTVERESYSIGRKEDGVNFGGGAGA